MARTTLPVCTFNNLSASYGAGDVLMDINAQIVQGEALALIGPNGSGKTTLLRAILHLCKITNGELKVLENTEYEKYKNFISYVPQISRLDPTFPVTVKQVVTMGLYSRIGWFKKIKPKDQKLVMDMLEKVGLADRANEKFGNLSGGQQQRVLVARATVSNPKLLLLDEPFNGLDQPNRKALINIIKDLKKENVTVIVSTHDLDLAYSVCEKVLIIKNKQIAFGYIESTLTGENISAAYGANSFALITDNEEERQQ